MNLQHLKYMLEVERVGSITKAASNLFMGQPNLSKAIKEIENEIGITVFERSARGVIPTEKGAEFLEYARAILVQMDKIEELYKTGDKSTIRFGVSVPRASYITFSFTEFVRTLDPNKNMSIDFRETSSMETIENVCGGISNLGVIRYDLDNEEYFISLLKEKNLHYEELLRFRYHILLSANDPLAELDEIPVQKLQDCIEIIHGDYEVPYLSQSYIKKTKRELCGKRIYVYERGSQFDILTQVKNSFMMVSPIPQHTLRNLELVQKKCRGLSKKYADCIIYPSSAVLNDYEKNFIEKLYNAADDIRS